jgi:hypothetical protein
VDRAHAAALQPPLEPEIEVRRVDTDEERNALGQQQRGERPAQPDELGQLAQPGEPRTASVSSDTRPAPRVHLRQRRRSARPGGVARGAVSVAASASPEASLATC